MLLYWQLYVDGGAATRILRDLHMSFLYFTGLTAAGAAIGAFASLGAGLADRWGRANLVAWGVAITSVITLVGFPLCETPFQFAACFAALSLVEGVVLVGTAALVRDFSPQIGRASAMVFCTLGPAPLGRVVTVVASRTLDHYDSWQSQFVICGIAGAVIAVAAIAFLRELAPNLRDQLMVDDRRPRPARVRAATGEGIEHVRGLRAFARRRQGARALPGPRRLARTDPLLHARRLRRRALATTFGYIREPGQRARQPGTGRTCAIAPGRSPACCRTSPRAQAVPARRRSRLRAADHRVHRQAHRSGRPPTARCPRR